MDKKTFLVCITDCMTTLLYAIVEKIGSFFGGLNECDEY